MAGAARRAIISYDAYLVLERETGQRYEWLDGQVYAITGGTPAHAALAAAVLRELGNLAMSCGCVSFSSDLRVRVTATGLSTYPDGAVVCGPLDASEIDRNAATNPALLVEVLSDSTEAYDRGEKFAHYHRVPSLRDYVLVSQHTRRIELYSREGDHWALRVAGVGESLQLTAMPGELSVDRVYAGIALESPAAVPAEA